MGGVRSGRKGGNPDLKAAREKLTPEQLAKNGRKGGLKQGENARQRKELKETLNILLSLPLDDKKALADIENIKSFAKLKGKNITVDQAMMIKLMQKALNGDLNAISMIRDTIGEKPSEKMEVKDVTPVIISGEDEIPD